MWAVDMLISPLVAVCILILGVIGYFDIKYRIIPDKIVYPSMVLAAGYALLSPSRSLWLALFGALIGIAIPWLAYLISSECIGLGDLKLGILAGLLVGVPRIFLVWLLAVMGAGIVGSVILVLRKKEIKGYIAFGPYICGATIGMLLFKGAGAI